MVFLTVLAGTILVLDQTTKLLVLWHLPLHGMRAIVPGFFNLVHVRNTGGAFSMFAGSGSALRLGLFIGLAVIVLCIIFYAYSKVSKTDHWTRAAYSAIAGGALGNLLDRVRLGEVIDFLDFHAGSYHWPAFNVADMAITTGAIMLLVSLVRGK